MAPSRRALSLCLATFALLGGLGASCSERTPTGNGATQKGSPDTAAHPPEAAKVSRPKPDARLLVITDLKGYLEPCGCTSRPLGGIDRMAARIAALRADGVPTQLFLAGETFFDGAVHGGVNAEASKSQEVWKAETIVDVLNGLGAVAATKGLHDDSYGADTAKALAAAAKFPLLAQGQLALGGGTNGALGAQGFVEGDDIGKSVAVVEKQASPIQIALVTGTRRYAREVAQKAGVSFVINGGLDTMPAPAPAKVGHAFVLNGGRQGQGLLVIDLYLRDPSFASDFTDWSDWTLAEARQHIWDRIRELSARIAEWDKDPTMRASADVAAQRAKLAEFRAELAKTQLPAKVEGNAFAARWVELGPEAKTDTTVTAKLRNYDKRVNTHNQTALASIQPEKVAPGESFYVGSEACATCHVSETTAWKATPHSRAYETLVTRDKQFNLSCVGCHVTGYMKPGGSTVTHNNDGKLVDVGCENCHGPGSAHAATPKLPNLIVSDTPETTCRTCHNPEHSDKFDFRVYRSMIVVPGHGMPGAAPKTGS